MNAEDGGTSHPVLRVEDLRIEFSMRSGALVAIDGVTFDIAKGEILGVVGESGAGKSLTGSALNGLLQPPGRIASGRIFLFGNRIDSLSEKEQRKLRGKHIGAIFQDPLTSLDPLFTVGRQLTETIRTHFPELSPRDLKNRAIKLLTEVGIADPVSRFNQYPHQFSGGMRQRIVIALALAGEPEMIVADEPTTALDVSVQAQILSLLKNLAESRGVAIMLVTHDMGVIAETTDRVAVMYAGRVVEIGPTTDIVGNAQHPYTQGLMASIPSLSRQPERLYQINGAMPRLGQWPPGCVFHSRCDKAGPRCSVEKPELKAAGDSCAACFLFQGGTGVGVDA